MRRALIVALAFFLLSCDEPTYRVMIYSWSAESVIPKNPAIPAGYKFVWLSGGAALVSVDAMFIDDAVTEKKRMTGHGYVPLIYKSE